MSSHYQKYSLLTRLFHWLGAVLLIMTWVAVEQGEQFIELHKSLGVGFLLWTFLRLVNRFVSQAPPTISMPKWQSVIAHLTHWVLYILMVAMPLTGVLMSMYSGRGMSIFGLMTIPALVAPNREMSKLMNTLHTDVVFFLLAVLVAAHVGAALYHQFVIKDNIIARMR